MSENETQFFHIKILERWVEGKKVELPITVGTFIQEQGVMLVSPAVPYFAEQKERLQELIYWSIDQAKKNGSSVTVTPMLGVEPNQPNQDFLLAAVILAIPNDWKNKQHGAITRELAIEKGWAQVVASVAADYRAILPDEAALLNLLPHDFMKTQNNLVRKHLVNAQLEKAITNARQGPSRRERWVKKYFH